MLVVRYSLKVSSIHAERDLADMVNVQGVPQRAEGQQPRQPMRQHDTRPPAAGLDLPILAFHGRPGPQLARRSTRQAAGRVRPDMPAESLRDGQDTYPAATQARRAHERISRDLRTVRRTARSRSARYHLSLWSWPMPKATDWAQSSQPHAKATERSLTHLACGRITPHPFPGPLRHWRGPQAVTRHGVHLPAAR